jgi:hypothetical protein
MRNFLFVLCGLGALGAAAGVSFGLLPVFAGTQYALALLVAAGFLALA